MAVLARRIVPKIIEVIGSGVNVRNPVATATDRDPRDTRNCKPASLDKFLLDQLLTGLLPVHIFCVISM